MTAADGIARVAARLCVRGHDLNVTEVTARKRRVCSKCVEPTVSNHGTYAYTSKGCRCETCADAWRTYQRRYYHATDQRTKQLGRRAQRRTADEVVLPSPPHFVTTVDLWLAEQRRKLAVDARNRLGGAR